MKKQNFLQTYVTVKTLFACIIRNNGIPYITAKIISAVENALVGVIYILLPGILINELTSADTRDPYKIAVLVAAIILISVLSRVFNIKWSHYTARKEQELCLSLMSELYVHTADLDYSLWENPDFHDTLSRVRQMYFSKVINVINQVSDLISAVLSITAVSSIIMTLNPIMLIVAIVPVCINAKITSYMKKKQHENETAVTAMRRKMTSAGILEKPNSILEVKFFGLKKFFIDDFVKHQTEIDDLLGKLDGKNLKAQAGYLSTELFQQSLVYIYLIYRVVKHTLSVGSMTIYLSAVAKFSSVVQVIVNSYINLSSNNLWIDDFLRYQTLAEANDDGKLIPKFDKNSVIEFKNVSFKYPNSERMVIDNLNLVIRGDEKLSIVGHNGSGKTTLIKLLIRFYEPTSGEILLNGVNIREYSLSQYQRIFAPVFQQNSFLYMSIMENIVLAGEYDRDKLDTVIRESGLDTLVNKLTKGYDTQVFKYFDETGIDPSGGEKQKLAIARACYMGGEIFLLDEPTAELDPISEYKIYKQFNNMIKNKSAVMITHRLSAVKLADRIVVLENGHVIENGTHKELYEMQGVYRDMYDKQSEFYRRENIDHEE